MKRAHFFALIGAFTAVFVLLSVLAGLVVRKSETNSQSLSGFPVYINEIMSSNSIYYDNRGMAYDWVELYNSADMDIRLSQYKLTDSERAVRYIFPDDAVIPARGYYVVWCNRGAGEGYANFSIAKAGGEVICLLNSRSVIIDRVVTLPLDENTVMARDEEGQWQVLPYGSPGFENGEAGHQQYLLAQRQIDFPVIINEVMSANRSFLDPNKRSSDWIELYNTSDERVDLSGLRLADRMDGNGYVFLSGTFIEAHDYLLIYCDGSVTDTSYAPFSLSRFGGESITLTSANLVLDRVITQAMAPDTSMALDANGQWQLCETPTPGFENSEQGYEQYMASIIDPDADIRISEVMAANRSCIQDAFGDFSDWIELGNYGNQAVDLGAYFLSDSHDNPKKWPLPSIILEPGEHIVVFASGRDAVYEGEAHTSFSLNRHQGVVTLSPAIGPVISRVEYTDLQENMSIYLDELTGEYKITADPTPGYPNDDAGHDAFQSARSIRSPLMINEVMTGNYELLRQGQYGYYDWVELKNTSPSHLVLDEFFITDNLSKTAYCALPSKSLAPEASIVLLCAGDTPLPRSEYAQVPLSLNALSENLYLLDQSGKVLDYIALQNIPYGASYGRLDAEGGNYYFPQPSPGKENATGYRLLSEPPATTLAPGVYHSDQPLSVSLVGEGDIYYTTDGSTPTTAATPYSGPITIDRTTVIRAAAVLNDRLISSPVTFNYFFNVEHTLPIIAIATDSANLYDKDIGILAGKNLFDRQAIRPANVAFYGEDGSFAADCGLKLHGAGSREKIRKKSFKVVFRARYGVPQLSFPLFEGNPITSFDSFLIRNGQDYSRTFMRDELLSQIALRGSERLLVQDMRFCVYYINGEYQGIYCIKEAFSSGYFASRYGVSKESVELQRGYIVDDSEFAQLVGYAQENDLKDDVHYQYIAARINLESLMDWCIYEAYSANNDLSVNVRYYRSTEWDNNRWHWALFDLDYAFYTAPTFEYILKVAWHGVLFQSLLDNAGFREMFLQRLAYQLENHLTDEALIERYYALREEIRSEVPREVARWRASTNYDWELHLQTLERNVFSGRSEQLKLRVAELMNIPLSKVESYFAGGAA